jgi:translocation and assembly module TamB
MTPLVRGGKRLLAALAIVLAFASVTGILLLRSGWFREQVRTRIVQEIERGTGGSVELGSFAFDWTNLTATVGPLVLHGKESPDEEPFLRIPSATLGLRLISMLERKVDLASLRVDQPSVRVVFYPDGSTNLPVPAVRTSSKSWAQNLIDLGIRHYEINHGSIAWGLRQVPLDIRGEDLRLEMNYQGRSSDYAGEFSSKRIRITSEYSVPVEVDASAKFTLSAQQAKFSKLSLAVGRSKATLVGAFTELRSPRGAFTVTSTIAVKDVASVFLLPLAPVGTATFEGNLNLWFSPTFDFEVSGHAAARGLAYTFNRLKLEDVSASAELRAVPEGIRLQSLAGDAMGTHVTGQAELSRAKEFRFEGKFDGLSVRTGAALFTEREVNWSGVLRGDASIEAVWGQPNTKASVNAVIVAGTEGTPVEGQISVNYDQSTGKLRLDNTRVSTPASRVEVSGTLGETLRVSARTTNFADILPALQLAASSVPNELPIRLDGGDASVNGTITGELERPRFQGQAAFNRVIWRGRLMNRVTSDVDASRDAVVLRQLALTRGAVLLAGDLRISQRNGSLEDGALTGQANVRNVSLEETAKEFNLDLPAAGTAAATVRVDGTLQSPILDGSVEISDASAYGERLGRVRSSVHYENGVVRASSGEASLGGGKLTFTLAFQHPSGDWKNGRLDGQFSTQGVMVSRVNALREKLPNADARIEASPTFSAHISNGAVSLDSVGGKVALLAVTVYGEPFGQITLDADTRGGQTTVQAKGEIRGTSIQSEGVWRLTSNEPGSGSLRFSRMNIATLYELVMAGVSGSERPMPPPFDGFLQGEATFSFPLLHPEAFQAEARIDTLQVSARASQALRLGVQPQDVTIRNSQPLILALSRDEARIRSAHFSARETNLEATGALPFRTSGGLDLTVKGTANLAELQLLNPDLLAKGSANVSASIRGSIRNPQVNGRMELNGASLYMADVPNGIDNASGVILFDRNRATVERLSAETGGGTVSLGGFLEFGDPLVYRLRAEVRQVRVRYPEDVSMTLAAQLALTGTSQASTMTGTVTLNRASINPGADFGRLLASGSSPATSPEAENEYLRGVRFDVKVDSSPTFELDTSLTRNIQASVDLRLRGSPRSPVLLGDISVNSGEAEMFGTRYTFNRGDIRFLNPLRIEPTLDVNLETRARGIIVTVSLSGTPERLNVNYSSDPPLQSREIIALLAVGRDPVTDTRFSSSQFSSSNANFSDAGGLLGQAVSQQLSNRFQRFLGTSRVKIDPTMTGVDNLPEARLTLEQQISRDITLTYITNLNRTQEQIVRVEWDFSPQWSAIAIRKASGLFGIDFQYRKRFK